MFNLFDILQAQSGQGMQALGQQFGLTPDQSRRAVEALLPALSIGLQRNAADPVGFGRLFGFAGAPAGEPSRQTQPDLLMGHLFGSQALSQAVLQQAAAASGIGTQALRQMLPLMAGMIVAGIVHMMLNQPPAAPAARAEPEPPPPSFPAADFWKDWMDNFLKTPGGSAPERVPGPTSKPILSNRTEAPSGTERTLPSEKPKRDGAAEPERDAPLEVLQQMFQTGAQVQEQNVKAMQELFDTFWQRPPQQPTQPEVEPVAEPAERPESKRQGTSRPRKPRT